MKIGIVIPFYLKGDKHNKPLSYSFAYYALLAEREGFTLHLCGSEGKLSQEFAEPYLSDRVKYIEVPQRQFTISSAGDDYLRKKFNDSLQTLPNDLHWYCLIGANDMIPDSFFDDLKAYNHEQVALAGVGSSQPLYIVPESGEPFRVKLSYLVDILPGVNAFSIAAMKKLDWMPYRYKGCETGAEKLVHEHGAVIQVPGHVVMLKGKTDLNSVAHIKKRHSSFPLKKEEVQLVRSYMK